jgi:hypothetical protein
MPEPKIQYSEYQSVVELLNKTDQDTVYQDLMQKEVKTLDTINKVIKFYKDNDYKSKQFIHLSFWEVIIRFGDVWSEMYADLSDPKKINYNVLFKGDRPIYIGISLVLLGFMLLFILLND